MPDQLTISIETRAKTGTTGARALRAQGKVPGVLYGHGTAPQHVALDAHALDDLLHHGGRTGLITLRHGSRKADTVLLREVQIDPVTRHVIHVDLQRVGADEAVHAKLPVVTVGAARGVREFGGVMDVIVHEIEVQGPANRLPERLEADVNELGIHEHLTAGEIALPEGFTLITPAETIVVAIEPSRTAAQLEEAALEPALEQAAPEVIGATVEQEPQQ